MFQCELGYELLVFKAGRKAVEHKRVRRLTHHRFECLPVFRFSGGALHRNADD